MSKTLIKNHGDGFYEIRVAEVGTDGVRERCMGTIQREGHGKWLTLLWLPGGNGGPAPEFTRRHFSTRRDARRWIEEHYVTDHDAIYCSKQTIDNMIQEVTVEDVTNPSNENSNGFLSLRVRNKEGEKQRIWICFDVKNEGCGWVAIESCEEAEAR